MYRTYAVSLVVSGCLLFTMSCENTARQYGDGERDQGEAGGGNPGASGDASAGGATAAEGGDESGGAAFAGSANGGSAGDDGTGTGGASTAGSSGSGGGTKVNGAACEAATECGSGVCGAEGVCCDVVCDGQCESCVSAASHGTCVAVTTPKTPCAGTGTSCGGTCSPTNRASCVYPTATTVCAAAACTAAGERGPSTCDGAGSCAAPNPTTCIYGCAGATCATCRQKDPTNLLTNPGFDGATTSWTGGTFANYSSNDADSCAGSGSFALDYLQDMSQCLNSVTVGTRYYMAFRFKGWDTSESHLGYCVVNFYGAADCNEFISSFDASATSNGPWATTVANNAQAPADAVSMAFACSGSVGHGYYDQLYLGTSSSIRY